MIWHHSYTAFLFGAAGGLAVNVIRLHVISHGQKDSRPDFDALYFWQLVGLTLIGGVLALAHDLINDINPLVALNVGLTVPALVKTGAEAKARTRKPKKTDHGEA